MKHRTFTIGECEEMTRTVNNIEKAQQIVDIIDDLYDENETRVINNLVDVSHELLRNLIDDLIDEVKNASI